MSQLDDQIRYTSSHEWVRQQDGLFVIGITDYAQNLLGDLVFVELPEVGTAAMTGSECGVVESVKSASDLYAPVSGEVAAVNTVLETQPELVNSDPYQAGWIFKVLPNDVAEYEQLLMAADYQKLIASE